MAKRKDRHTISLARGVGRRLEAYCEQQGIAKSALVEYLLANPDAMSRDLNAFHRWNDARRVGRYQRRISVARKEA